MVTVYALGDMMIYNRRKKAEFFAEQKAMHMSKLHDAQMAIKAGTASEEQVHFIQQERMLDAEDAAKKARKGAWARSKEWLFSGLKKDDVAEEQVNKIQDSAKNFANEAESALRESKSSILQAVGERKDEVRTQAKSALETEKERQRHGGPLDRIGASDEPPQSSGGGWTSFMTRR